MQQLYTPQQMEENVGWRIGLDKAQTKEMMLSKGLPTPSP
jgi:hypothetical protein